MKRLEREKKIKERGEIYSALRVCLFVSIAAASLSGFACQPNQTVLKDVVPQPTALATVDLKKTSFEEDLKDMQTADFDYILAFRRKDGGVFSDDDRKYLRQNTPLETNRWTRSEEGRVYLAGSGFGFQPEQIEALKKRFVVEDYSKPEVRSNSNANAANSNADRAVNANR